MRRKITLVGKCLNNFQAAIKRVLENWNALQLFFTSEYQEENLHSTKLILDSLYTKIFKVYFSFLAYILDIVNNLNLEFQSEKPKIHYLSKRIRSLYESILRNYLKKECLEEQSVADIDPSNPRYFMSINEMYFGAKCELLLSNNDIDRSEIENFRLRALDFYVELAKQIKKRFRFNDPVLKFAANFDPEVVVSGKIKSIAVDALKLFPQLVNDVEQLNTEYRFLSQLPELKAYYELKMKDHTENKKRGMTDEFWMKVFQMENSLNEQMFPSLTVLVKGIFSLPHSSAAAERIFSQMNLIKTKTRNRLLIETCDNMLHAKQLMSNNYCYDWKPSRELLKRNATYDKK